VFPIYHWMLKFTHHWRDYKGGPRWD
jgi:hypothetical protein